MKERILTGWTFKRALYIIMGSYLIIQSIVDRQWLFILFGVYFAAMGLFAFGCASGNCFGGSCNVEPGQKVNSESKEVDFEEIK
jgi:hypothetical protein